ncbi:MAG TPA: glycosyltransferase family 2 protein [Coxiellaceae bacterium]|nr:glycosyltransferase family 2 protein [Coxiellaceae bacterium]
MTEKTIDLSVILICYNEAKRIERCLDSVKWAKEIIILDSGSTDNTVQLCKAYTEHVSVTDDWPGYGLQKARALAKATHEWVLSIDADEVVTPELKNEIEQAIKNTSCSGYKLRRPLLFYGKLIRYADGASHTLRLFQRTKGHISSDIVHETIQVDGPVRSLKSPLLHYSFDDISDLLAKMNRYSSLSAQKKHQQGKKGGLFTAITHAAWLFIRIYFINLGCLDGKAGFVLAMAFAETAYYRYIKLLYPDQLI